MTTGNVDIITDGLFPQIFRPVYYNLKLWLIDSGAIIWALCVVLFIYSFWKLLLLLTDR